MFTQDFDALAEDFDPKKEKDGVIHSPEPQLGTYICTKALCTKALCTLEAHIDQPCTYIYLQALLPCIQAFTGFSVA